MKRNIELNISNCKIALKIIGKSPQKKKILSFSMKNTKIQKCKNKIN